MLSNFSELSRIIVQYKNNTKNKIVQLMSIKIMNHTPQMKNKNITVAMW